MTVRAQPIDIALVRQRWVDGTSSRRSPPAFPHRPTIEGHLFAMKAVTKNRDQEPSWKEGLP